MNGKKLLVKILNELVNEGELVVYNSKTEELLSGEDIGTVCITGDIIHICLSESIIIRRAK